MHSVSYANELIFNDRIEQLQEHPLIGEYADRLRFIPVVTREAGGKLNQRLPDLLKSGQLATALDLPFTPADTRFMICGNPAMVKDTFQALLDMGFAMHRNRIPGQIMMENGF